MSGKGKKWERETGSSKKYDAKECFLLYALIRLYSTKNTLFEEGNNVKRKRLRPNRPQSIEWYDLTSILMMSTKIL